MIRVALVIQDIKVHQVHLDKKDPKEIQEVKVKLVPWDQQGLKEHLVIEVFLDYRDHKDQLVHEELEEHRYV